MVPKSGSLDVNYTCTYATAPSSYSGTNTATATWNEALAFTPGDTADGKAEFTLTQLGSTNKTVHVSDDTVSSEDYLGSVTATDSAPFATGTFTYSGRSRVSPAPAPSTTTRPRSTETEQSDKETVEVCVGKDLTVTKTAAGTFNRTLPLVDRQERRQDPGQDRAGRLLRRSPTRSTSTQTGISDAGWTLAGKITISNPNDWQDVTLTSLVDAVDNGGACTVDAGPYVVPKSGSLDVNYTCSYATAPSSYSGTNTATATWNETLAFTPGDTADGKAEFTLTQLGSTNKTVHVSDDKVSSEDYIGSVTATDSAPFATGTFTYKRTLSGVAGTCTKYDNTATIEETEQSAKVTVEVCVGKDLTVTKTAAGTFDRTLPLVDRQERRQDPGQDRAGRLATRSPTRSTSSRPASAMPAGRSPARSRSATPTTGRTSLSPASSTSSTTAVPAPSTRGRTWSRRAARSTSTTPAPTPRHPAATAAPTPRPRRGTRHWPSPRATPPTARPSSP